MIIDQWISDFEKSSKIKKRMMIDSISDNAIKNWLLNEQIDPNTINQTITFLVLIIQDSYSQNKEIISTIISNPGFKKCLEETHNSNILLSYYSYVKILYSFQFCICVPFSFTHLFQDIIFLIFLIVYDKKIIFFYSN